MKTSKRLTEVYNSAPVIPYDRDGYYIIMSDCHRGVGNWGDNFMPNQSLFFAALQYYYKHGYTYIELGDGDELWENRDMDQIVRIHSDTFWLMSKFYKEQRFYMLYGNHDKIKKNPKFRTKYMQEYFCDSTRRICSLFPGIEVYEGIRLQDQESGWEIFMTHGHQGEFINDRIWFVGRFLVRYVWRTLELLGMKDPTGEYESNRQKNRTELAVNRWADANEKITITGHTHRAIFPIPGESLHFNDGCCVHPRCIMGLEINQGQIQLVKWSVLIREDGVMYVGKTVLEGPVSLGEY